MKIDTNDKQEIAEPIKDSVQFPALAIDWDLFGSYLDDSDLDDNQKREFIEIIWYIVVTFVDLGFGIEPVQQAILEGQKEQPNLALPFLEVIEDSVLSGAFETAKNKITGNERNERGI